MFFGRCPLESSTPTNFKFLKITQLSTGWYHPHYHTKVAPQVFGGLAGPLIVRGELDNIPELQQAEEALLVLQDVDPRVQADSESLPTLAKRWGREGNLLLANGQQNPVIDLPQNGLLRLRLVNASASRIYQLQLWEHPWHLMATDRGAIAETRRTQNTVFISRRTRRTPYSRTERTK